MGPLGRAGEGGTRKSSLANPGSTCPTRDAALEGSGDSLAAASRATAANSSATRGEVSAAQEETESIPRAAQISSAVAAIAAKVGHASTSGGTPPSVRASKRAWSKALQAETCEGEGTAPTPSAPAPPGEEAAATAAEREERAPGACGVSPVGGRGVAARIISASERLREGGTAREAAAKEGDNPEDEVERGREAS